MEITIVKNKDEARKIGTKYMEEKIPLIDKYQKEYEEKSAHHGN